MTIPITSIVKVAGSGVEGDPEPGPGPALPMPSLNTREKALAFGVEGSIPNDGSTKAPAAPIPSAPIGSNGGPTGTAAAALSPTTYSVLDDSCCCAFTVTMVGDPAQETGKSASAHAVQLWTME